jgi:hypothetical protein
MAASNLPITSLTDAGLVKTFFNNLTKTPMSFPAAQIDAGVAFFIKRGFDTSGANSVAIVLLNQARTENVNVFTLLDTLKGLTDVQLSQVVAQVLNASRDRTSLLGYRKANTSNTYEARNILI